VSSNAANSLADSSYNKLTRLLATSILAVKIVILVQLHNETCCKIAKHMY